MAIAELAARALFAGRAALGRRGAELVVYATIALGLLVLIGLSSFLNREGEGLGFAEPRYLLPLLPLTAALLVLAVRGAGRRFGPLVGVFVFAVFLTHDVFSQLLVAARFYG